jgi:hypothetical protein
VDALAARAKAGPSATDDGGLASAGSTLAALLSDLEAADGPPTRAQRELQAELSAQVAKAAR